MMALQQQAHDAQTMSLSRLLVERANRLSGPPLILLLTSEENNNDAEERTPANNGANVPTLPMMKSSSQLNL
jgi:hypothetical protein